MAVGPAGRAPLAGVTIVFPAGGKGERLAQLAEAQKVNKAALQAGGQSMIERSLRMYSRAGARNFVALVFHQAQSVMDQLGDGSKYGVTIAYSVDPEKPVGKGGAILTAIERGVIPADKPFIVHNPDDQVLGIEERFPRMTWSKHRSLVRRGALATAVCVPWTEYAYSAFIDKRGMAASAVMYPKVHMPTHIGVTLFEPGAVAIFRKLIDLTKKVDFESVVLPWMAKRGKLGLSIIPAGAWIPVNDMKNYNKLVKYFEDHPEKAA